MSPDPRLCETEAKEEFAAALKRNRIPAAPIPEPTPELEPALTA